MCKKIKKRNLEKKDKKRNWVFKILITNPEYWIWIVYMIIASSSFIVGAINSGKDVFIGGTLYYISMSIIAPMFVDFLIENIELKKNKEQNLFLTRKTIVLGICVACLILCFIFISTTLKNNMWLQLVMLAISIVVSLYMFCLNRLYLQYDEYKDLDDKPYADDINETVKDLSEKQDNIQSVKNEKGDEIKL